MPLFSYNGNLAGETSQNLNNCVIGFDVQSRSPSKELSKFLPSRPQSTNVFLYKTIQFPYLFSSFLSKSDTPKWPLIRYKYDASMYWNQFFPKLQVVYPHPDSFYFLDSFEKWKLELHCSLRKLGWLKIPKLAYACDSCEIQIHLSKTIE